MFPQFLWYTFATDSNSSCSSLDTKEKILSKAEELFLKYGLRSITMDDMARELGISKKTLYQYVDNKEDLINQVFSMHVKGEEDTIRGIFESVDNAIEEMVEIGRHVTRMLRTMNPNVLYDMQKYYPKQWQMYTDFKMTFVYSTIKKNIEKGINQGLYRRDFKTEVIVKLYIARMDLIMDQELFPTNEYRTQDIYHEYLRYHIRGIATEKGAKILDSQNFE